MASKFAVYDPPQEGLPYLVVLVIGGATEAFPAKTRAEAEALLTERKDIWESAPPTRNQIRREARAGPKCREVPKDERRPAEVIGNAVKLHENRGGGRKGRQSTTLPWPFIARSA